MVSSPPDAGPHAKAKAMPIYDTDYDTLNRDADKADRDLKSDLRDSAKDAEKAAKQFRAKASDYADDAGKKINDFADKARAELKKATDSLEGHVRSNPLPAAAALLTAGLVLGAVLRGKRRYS